MRGPVTPRLVAFGRSARCDAAQGAEGRRPGAELVDEGHLNGGPGVDAVKIWFIGRFSGRF